jgi:hypothetical protein
MTNNNFYSLPKDFLSGPAPNPTVHPINFTETALPEYKDFYAVILDGILTPSECRSLVSAAEEHSQGQWERAMVNIGGGQQKLLLDTRNCGRIIWDNQEIVARIWKRVEGFVPELQRLDKWPAVTGIRVRKGEVWKCTRLNERMRFLKYTSGEYFKRE